ncbi:endonuclease/exonuclease/phosphatase family protein [Algoriphagus vanfongensis]|uniref:endonuclease/exonuclease/phosphatase family protein n=1 Tax=Algoriphagus vanfongensis TaxID=426371 RepID=UPI00041B7E2E|nr:endonuclease/exonuclease/phosphatase family protein [Algoriphagus vanfongensis]
MRIVSWNCNGAFRKKFQFITKLNADIYIIQECENPEETSHKEYKEWASNYLWIGNNKNKGLAIFAKKEITIEKLYWSNEYLDHSVKHFLPCRINQKFNLLGVWTHYNNSPNFGYMGQFWKYLQINKSQFSNIIIAGDFNSNKIWDQWDRWWNHSDVIRELEEIGIESLYHIFFGEPQGEEKTPTLYLQRRLEKPYHIDYIFGSKNFQKINHLEIGHQEVWLEISDHMPVICKFHF